MQDICSWQQPPSAAYIESPRLLVVRLDYSACLIEQVEGYNLNACTNIPNCSATSGCCRRPSKESLAREPWRLPFTQPGVRRFGLQPRLTPAKCKSHRDATDDPVIFAALIHNENSSAVALATSFGQIAVHPKPETNLYS